MFSPAGGGVFSTRGKRERSSLSGMVRWGRASIGRCLRMGGMGLGSASLAEGSRRTVLS